MCFMPDTLYIKLMRARESINPGVSSRPANIGDMTHVRTHAPSAQHAQGIFW